MYVIYVLYIILALHEYLYSPNYVVNLSIFGILLCTYYIYTYIQSKDVKKYVISQLTTVQTSLSTLRGEIQDLSNICTDTITTIDSTKQYCDQLHKCLSICNEVYNNYPVKGIASAVGDAELRYKHYLYSHEEVYKMFRMMADIAPSSSSNNNTNSTTKNRSNNSNSSIHIQSLMSAKDKIRLKHIHEYTSQDELDFACLDMALYCNNNTATSTTNNSNNNNNNNNNNDNKSNSTNNTLLYTHLSPIEKEEIRFRSPNISNYPYFRLNFLLNLPEQINLALPFLTNEFDIHIYYLINKYYRQHDDIYYQYIDHTTGGNSNIVHTNNNGNNSVASSITSSAEYAAYCVSYMQARDPSYIHSDTSSIEHAEAVLIHECIDIRVKYHFIRAYLEQNGHNSDLSSLLLDTTSSSASTTGGVGGESNMGSISSVRRKSRAGGRGDVKAMPLLTREQFAWVVLDYSLNPHLYQPPDASITDPTATIHTTSTTINPTAPPQHDTAAVLNILRLIEGILGPPLTSTANETATDLTDTLRIYTKERLLQLHEDSIYTDANPGDLDGYVSTLLRRYYLPTDATALGYDRLGTLAKLDSIIHPPPVVTASAHTNTDTHGAGSDTNSLRRRGSVASRRASIIPLPPRVYGSWEQVHPAALGAQSQSTPFISYDYDPRLHHPGSYSATPVHTPRSTTNSSTDNPLNPHLSLQSRSSNNTNNNRFTHLNPQMRTGYTLLTSGSTSTNQHTTTSQTIYTDYTSSYLIIPSLTDLATMSLYDISNKDVLIENKSEPALCILSQQNNSLLTRQSKTHQFEIPDNNTNNTTTNNNTNNSNNKYMLDITISIIYQGIFTTTGEYKCGRIGGSLFRIPSKIDKNPSFSSPIPLGYSPIDLQAPNSISQFGRLCIIHRPSLRPLLPGVYQVVLGCGEYVCIYVCMCYVYVCVYVKVDLNY